MTDHRQALTPSDITRLQRIAARGLRVMVETGGVRVTVEPVDMAAGDVQPSTTEGLTCDEIMARMGSG
jgi:hypothetical protein